MATPEHPLLFLFRPPARSGIRTLAAIAVPLLGLSALLVLAGTAAMPDGYSWRFHSISESAAQGQPGGWIARMSFMSFGAAVLAVSVSARTSWPRLTYWMQASFAFLMFGAAAFSHAPWVEGASSDQVEDLLHSVCASGMGLAFCVGVVARFVQRGLDGLAGRALDLFALVTAIVLPLLLASSSSAGGLVQRIMFVVGYVWFGREALYLLGVLRQRNEA
jgi:putative copper export protein